MRQKGGAMDISKAVGPKADSTPLEKYRQAALLGRVLQMPSGWLIHHLHLAHRKLPRPYCLKACSHSYCSSFFMSMLSPHAVLGASQNLLFWFSHGGRQSSPSLFNFQFVSTRSSTSS